MLHIAQKLLNTSNPNECLDPPLLREPTTPLLHLAAVCEGSDYLYMDLTTSVYVKLVFHCNGHNLKGSLKFEPFLSLSLSPSPSPSLLYIHTHTNSIHTLSLSLSL